MHTCGAQRPVAGRWLRTATALVRCREDDSKNPDMCWYKRGFLNFFFVEADVLFWKRSSFVYLEESVRVPSFVPSSLRHRCRSWRLMFLKSVSRLPDYPTLKNDSHEAWKCSVTRKKYFERPHTAVFRRQRLGTTPSTQIFKQDDHFGAKRRRRLLDQYANTLLGSCNGLRSYQPTSCGCQGSVFLEWTIGFLQRTSCKTARPKTSTDTTRRTRKVFFPTSFSQTPITNTHYVSRQIDSMMTVMMTMCSRTLASAHRDPILVDSREYMIKNRRGSSRWKRCWGWRH